jgi:hypothetical protein
MTRVEVETSVWRIQSLHVTLTRLGACSLCDRYLHGFVLNLLDAHKVDRVVEPGGEDMLR